MIILYAIYILINIKKLLKEKERFFTICVIALIGVAITAFFTLPMLEQLIEGNYRISSYFGTESLANLAMNFVGIFDFNTNESNYLIDSVGPFLLLVPLLYFFVRKKDKSTIATYLTIAGLFMVIMTTNMFPWKYFEFMSFLQFPSRILVPATAFLALSSGYTIANLSFTATFKNQITKIFILIFTIVCILQLFALSRIQGAILKTTTAQQITDDALISRSEWYCLLELSTPDYLPADTNINYRDYKSTLVTNNEETLRGDLEYNGYNDFTFTYKTINDGAYYIAPLTYYKGYYAEIYGDGDTLIQLIPATRDPETGLVRFEPAPYSENTLDLRFKVYYIGTNIQSLSIWLSFTTLIMYLLFLALYHFVKKVIERKIFS